MTRWIPLLLAATLLGGCHARFKKHVDQIDDVRPELNIPFGPHVQLGGVASDGEGVSGVIAAVINTTQTVKSIDLTRRINESVDPNGVADALVDELGASFRKGPPFVVDPASDTTLELQLTAYGVEVAALGMPGVLTYTMNSRIYLPNGKRVYTAGHRCNLAFSDPSAAAIVFGTVNNARAIKDMSPEEIQSMFEGGARWCAQQVAMRIRRHGG